jgi:hypothetical protein
MKSIRGLAMSEDEVLKYNQLGKKTFRILIGGSDFDGNPPNNRWKFKTLIFNFRSISTVVSIINLIHWIKIPLLNFEISNGLDFISSSKLIDDWKIYEKDFWLGKKINENSKVKGYFFKVIEDKFLPIYNKNNLVFHQELQMHGLFNPPDLYSDNDYYKIFDQNFYADYDERFFFNIENEYRYRQEFDNDFFSRRFNYMPILSKINHYAIISLESFFKSDITIISYLFNDILNLSELEKVKEYKIKAQF